MSGNGIEQVLEDTKYRSHTILHIMYLSPFMMQVHVGENEQEMHELKLFFGCSLIKSLWLFYWISM
jgi:hypothetical protein